MNNEALKQHSMEDYLTDEEKIKMNIPIRKDIEKNSIRKNNDKIDEFNGSVEVKYGNEIYRIWKVEFIRPFIFKFLKEKYPDSLIVHELNKIDITLFDNQFKNIIPIEIQKTPTNGEWFKHSEFEDAIRRQLEDNIENYELCWFFFDAEYHRLLQYGNVGKSTSIDLTWLVKLMKENKLKVFAIKYDGTVKELTTKDFDFLKIISQTCKIGYDNTERILNRNKLKIYYNEVRGYNFTQEDIIKFEIEFKNRNDKNDVCRKSYFRKSNNEISKLYGSILKALGNLSVSDEILSCNSDSKTRVSYAVTLGLFEQNNFNGNDKQARIQFVDKFNIAQYFPGYIRNKEMWDYCKNKKRVFTMDEFRGIIERTFNYEFIKKQSTMLDY